MKRVIVSAEQDDSHEYLDKLRCSANIRRKVYRAIEIWGWNKIKPYVEAQLAEGKYGFDIFEFDEVITGFVSNIDADVYGQPIGKYNWEQMREIRLALKSGKDVKYMLDPNLTPKQMKNIRKTGKVSKDSGWPRKQFWARLDYPFGEDFEAAWNEYLASIENRINDELNITVEPSIQGEYGEMFIHDNYKQNDSIRIDFYEWCDTEIEIAKSCKSSEEYGQRYKQFVEDTIQDADWN